MREGAAHLEQRVDEDNRGPLRLCHLDHRLERLDDRGTDHRLRCEDDHHVVIGCNLRRTHLLDSDHGPGRVESMHIHMIRETRVGDQS